jgi:hypothetical protein
VKKRNRPLQHLPRSVKAVLNLVLLVLLILLYYVSIGCPALSPEQQFRREEKANLVGPAKILGTISLKKSYNPCNRLIIATSDEGVTLFQYDKSDLECNKFVYRKKQGDVTVFSVPSIARGAPSLSEIPVIVFDSFHEAVRAEMEIELPVLYHSKIYRLAADRDADGYFFFTLTRRNYDGEYRGFSLLTEISDDLSDRLGEIPVTVRFYDQSDNMIAERYVEIRSPAGEEFAKELGNT